MIALRQWSPLAVAVACFAWVAIWISVFAPPLVRAGREMKALTEQHEVAAVSFALGPLLAQVAVVVLPPVALVIAWLVARSHEVPVSR